jgi:nucleoside-diphosphate-sugar epimerase
MRGAVAVSGARGYLGARVVGALQADGWSVVALIRPGAAPPPGAVAVPWDERADPEAVGGALADHAVGSVIHLAALYRRSHGPHDVGPLIATNVDAGARLLEAARLAGVRRVVSAASWFEHGGPGGGPANLYAATRRAFDALLDWYAERAAFDVVRLVIHDVYGPADDRPRLIPALLRARATGEPATLLRSAGALDPVHVDDVAAAFVLGLTAPTGRWSLGSGETTTLAELVARLEAAGGLPVPHRWVDGPTGPAGVAGDTPRLPGWAPSIGLDVGLAALCGGVERG